MVERPRQSRDPGARDRAEARLHAPHAAEGGWPHDGTGGLGAERERHAAGGDGRGRAAGGAARRARERVGVAGGAGGAAGELGGHGLAEDQGAGRAQAAHHRRVRPRPAAGVEPGAVLGRLVGGVDDVLDADGNAGKRPARAGGIDCPRPLAGRGSVEVAPGPDRRLGLGNAGERRRAGRFRPLAAGADPGCDLVRARAFRQRRRVLFRPVGGRHCFLIHPARSSFVRPDPPAAPLAWQAWRAGL